MEHHYAETRAWLARVSGHGFPTLAIESAGRLQRIDLSAWYGRPEDFVEAVRPLLGNR